MISYLHVQPPAKDILFITRNSLQKLVDFLWISRDCGTVRAVFAGNPYPVLEIRIHFLAPKSESGHCALFAGLCQLSTVVGNYNCCFSGDSPSGVRGRNLATRMADDRSGLDTPCREDIYKSDLNSSAEWL
jgi:hypothetical protein